MPTPNYLVGEYAIGLNRFEVQVPTAAFPLLEIDAQDAKGPGLFFGTGAADPTANGLAYASATPSIDTWLAGTKLLSLRSAYLESVTNLKLNKSFPQIQFFPGVVAPGNDAADYWITEAPSDAEAFRIYHRDVSAGVWDIQFQITAGGLNFGANTVWHSGNFTPGNYLPLTGGTLTGRLTLASTGPDLVFNETDQTTEHYGFVSGSGAWGIARFNRTTGNWARNLLSIANDDSFTFASTATFSSPILAGGLLFTSTAKLQVNGFQRTGNIYLHAGGNTPNTTRTSDYLANNAGELRWAINNTEFAVWTANNFDPTSKLSTSGGTLTGTLTLSSTVPRLTFYETDAAVDAKRMDFFQDAGVFTGRLYTDGGSGTGGDWLTVTRSGNAPQVINLIAPSVQANGNILWHTGNDGSGSGLDADLFDGAQKATLVPSLRSMRTLTGGGNLIFTSAGEFAWGQRFVVICNGRGTLFGTAGFFDILMPAAATVITAVGGGTNQTVTAGGIPMTNGTNSWVALYYILPIGSTSTSLPANFRLVSYTADLEVPEHWVLLAIRNGDTGNLWVANGISLRVNSAFHTATYSSEFVPNADTVDGLHASAFESAFSKGDLVQGSGVTLSGTLASRLVGSGNVTVSVTGFEPSFSKGNLIQGSGVTLTGTLTGRLVGSGDVTITSTSSGVTDHGLLTGLGDDDHTQYHTDARGDARYLLLTGGTVNGNVGLQGVTTMKAAAATLTTHSVPVWETDPSTSGSAIRFKTLANFKTDLGTMPPSAHVHDAGDVTTGTFASARLSGAYSGISGVGALSSLTVNGVVTVLGLGTDLTTGVGAKFVMRLDANGDLRGVTLAGAKTYLAYTIADIPTLQTTLDAKALKTTSISTGTGLSGGGDLSASRTISLANTTVVAGAYGASGGASVPYFTVDAQGRITVANSRSLTTSDIGAVPTSRTISTGTGLSGGGDLTTNRTISMANTTVAAGSYGAASGASVPYFTVDAQGRLTAAASRNITMTDIGGVQVAFATTVQTTVSSGTTAETTLLGTVKGSKTVSIATGDVLNLVLTGTYNTGGSSNWSNGVLRVKFGSYVISFTFLDAGSEVPAGWPWRLEVNLIALSASTANALGFMDLQIANGTVGVDAAYVGRLKGVVSGTFATGSQTVDVTWDNDATQVLTMTCDSAVLLKY